MTFNSYIFILLFLPLSVVGYFVLNKYKKYEWAKLWIFGMSLWFYGYFNWKYLSLLIISILLNFCISKVIQKESKQSLRKLWMFIGIACNLGILFYFKYYDFFVENINHTFQASFELHHLLLPLGISFFTFQQLSYIIDCYKDKSISYCLLDYATYVSFFPQLVAGPIVLHTELVPQFQDIQKKKADFDNLAVGLYGFSLGLAKKVLIADNLSKIVVAGYTDVIALNGSSAIIVMFCYTLQIYFDFSGYCDMAMGIGKLFNIEIPENFNSPYKATSITEFWNRWHITLTRFFTYYVYIPLGGNRRGKARMLLNTMIIFLISGLWHGANWTFVLWGALHGTLVTLYKAFEKWTNKIPKILGWLLTFLFVNFAWIYFRADSIVDANFIISQIVGGNWGEVNSKLFRSFNDMVEVNILYKLDVLDIFKQCAWLANVLLLSGLIFGCVFLKNTQEKMKTFQPKFSKLLVSTTLLLWSIISLSGVSEFLYFNF